MKALRIAAAALAVLLVVVAVGALVAMFVFWFMAALTPGSQVTYRDTAGACSAAAIVAGFGGVVAALFWDDVS